MSKKAELLQMVTKQEITEIVNLKIKCNSETVLKFPIGKIDG